MPQKNPVIFRVRFFFLKFNVHLCAQGPEYVQLVWNFRALSRADTLALTELGDEIPPMIYEYPIILAALLTLDSQSSSDSTLARKFFTVEMESYSPMQYNLLPFLLDQLLHDSQPP
ncbi:hypothetical protein Y032_0178g633 [Ancylostoma ceylanicum]|nr:hypothetical protein Y032_0178g633 [Ancylostoma ceylanicum]